MLDLGLGHLGIDIGEVDEPDLDAVVKACGESTSQQYHPLSLANSLRNLIQCSTNWILVDVRQIKLLFLLLPIKLSLVCMKNVCTLHY